jgi:hypothetical protein
MVVKHLIPNAGIDAQTGLQRLRGSHFLCGIVRLRSCIPSIALLGVRCRCQVSPRLRGKWRKLTSSARANQAEANRSGAQRASKDGAPHHLHSTEAISVFFGFVPLLCLLSGSVDVPSTAVLSKLTKDLPVACVCVDPSSKRSLSLCHRFKINLGVSRSSTKP